MAVIEFKCLTCGTTETSDAHEYDGIGAYEAVICKKCGAYSDEYGHFQAEKWSREQVGLPEPENLGKMFKSAKQHRTKLQSIRITIVETICSRIKKSKATVIRLNEPIFVEAFDDQFSKSIDVVNVETKQVNIDCSDYCPDYSELLADLKTDYLLKILECIEVGAFEIEE